MENYFLEINDSIYPELQSVIDGINENKFCSSCGGDFLEATCRYCDNKKIEMEVFLNKLYKILKKYEDLLVHLNFPIPLNKTFNLLFRIKDIDEVNKLLNKYNYDEKFRKGIELLSSKIEDEKYELTKDDIDLLETFISVVNNKGNIQYLFKDILKRCIKKKNTISLESFKTLTIKFIKTLIENQYSNAKCEIVEYDDKDLHGKSIHNKIEISLEDIVNFYNDVDYSLLLTIGHEFTHTIQYKNIFQNGYILDELVIMEIKDYILSNNIRNYYNDNYDFISYENEARLYGLLFSSMMLKELGEEKASYFFFKMWQVAKENLLYDKRFVNGEEVSLNLAFDEYIKDHPEKLDNHPQLKRLYGVLDNEIVYLKSDDEMLEDYEKEINSLKLNDEQKKSIQEFYSRYIDIHKI